MIERASSEKGNHMKSVDQSSSEIDPSWEYPKAGLKYVTPEEGAEILDREAREHLGMSGEEFVRRYEAGELDDDDYDFHVMRISMLIPFTKTK